MKDNFNEDYFGPGNDYEEQSAYYKLEDFEITWRDCSLFRFFKRQKCEIKINYLRFKKWFLHQLREPFVFLHVLLSLSFKTRFKLGFCLVALSVLFGFSWYFFRYFFFFDFYCFFFAAWLLYAVFCFPGYIFHFTFVVYFLFFFFYLFFVFGVCKIFFLLGLW